MTGKWVFLSAVAERVGLSRRPCLRLRCSAKCKWTRSTSSQSLFKAFSVGAPSYLLHRGEILITSDSLRAVVWLWTQMASAPRSNTWKVLRMNESDAPAAAHLFMHLNRTIIRTTDTFSPLRTDPATPGSLVSSGMCDWKLGRNWLECVGENESKTSPNVRLPLLRVGTLPPSASSRKFGHRQRLWDADTWSDVSKCHEWREKRSQ